MGTAERDNATELPSGYVTFVFTDIEGSTRLYKALGEELAGDVFDLHNEILRAAWTAHNGLEVHTEGDSFFVAFEDPNDAVQACLDVRRNIAAADWPQDGDVKVRIGIHCGLATPRNGDYMALSVHQAARIMSAAHGDQVLVTDELAARLDPIQGASLTTLGSFRLRDFDQPPLLHRVDVDDLVPNEQPARATPANQHNLVPALTSFVGRSADTVTVNGLLEAGRAVTIVGPGGMGKTRLATEVGIEVAPAWDAGVWIVELAEVLDPELVAEEVALSIGAPTANATNLWHNVLEHIGDQTMLLILDNVEHVVDQCAQLVPELLRACPHATVLSTSREPLNCAGEVAYRLQPLGLESAGADPTTLTSVELFIDRAHAISTGLEWTPAALETVAEICRHLDGLPLAIEVAAAQVGVLQLDEILDGLNNHFRLLRSRDRALPERQRTMEGLLGWSYRLLSDTEQRAFRRLAVFSGSFSINAAEAALSGDGIDIHDVPELVWTLVDKSLIAADFSDSATRYRLFETVQQYGMGLLIDNDDPIQVGVRFGQWLLERVGPWQVSDPRWLGTVGIEVANIRGVVDLIGDAEPEMAQQLMCTLGRYHDTMQSYQVGIEELTRASAELLNETPTRVALLGELAYLHLRTGNSAVATEILDTARELQSRVGPAPWNDVAVERASGEIAVRAGEFSKAIEIANATLATQLSERGSARMWSLIGIAESSQGNLDVGLEALQRSLQIYIDLGDASHITIAHANVAEAAWRLSDFEAAAHHQRESLQAGLAISHQLAIATSLEMAARLAARRNEWANAVRMQEHAAAMLRRAGHEPYEDEATTTKSVLQLATQQLGQEAMDQLGDEGRQLPAMSAAELAFSTFDEESQQSERQCAPPT